MIKLIKLNCHGTWWLDKPGHICTCLNLARMTKIRSCFLVDVFITYILHISSLWMQKALFQTEHQIAITNTPLISVSCLMGLQLGAAVSFTIYVGTGSGSSEAPEHCSAFKTGRTHCSLMHAGDKKTNDRGSRGTRQQAKEDDNRTFFSRCLTLFCARSRLTGLYALVCVEGKFLCQQPEYMGCLTVSS